LSQLKQNFAKVKLGGGEKNPKLQRKENGLRGNALIILLDPKATEISFVGEGTYADHGGCPSEVFVVKWDTSKGNNVISLQMMPP
jgi:hypothetical protein